MKKNLLHILFSLGVHIGHLKEENLSCNSRYLLGDIKKLSIFNLQLTLFHLKRALLFLKELGFSNGNLLFHSSNLYFYNWNLRTYLIHLIVFKEKQSLFFEKWKNGCVSNYQSQAVDFLNLIDFLNFKRKRFEYTKKKRSPKRFYIDIEERKWKFNSLDKKKLIHNELNWLDFMVQIVYYVEKKKIIGLNWYQEWKRIGKFWRFYYYFKFYHNFLKWPDLLILVNGSNRDSIISEVNRKKIPILGSLDSNSKGNGLNYFIPSNDDSSLLTLFYFRIFLNSYNKGKILFFNQIKK